MISKEPVGIVEFGWDIGVGWTHLYCGSVGLLGVTWLELNILLFANECLNQTTRFEASPEGNEMLRTLDVEC